MSGLNLLRRQAGEGRSRLPAGVRTCRMMLSLSSGTPVCALVPKLTVQSA